MNIAEKRIEWKARFDAWKVSGLSAAEWCRDQDIKVHQMYYWIRKFNGDSTADTASETKWFTVNMQDLPTGPDPVLIHMGQMSLEVRPGTDMALLSKVMHMIQNQ